ncbi:MAG: hypothetical protein GEV12_01300 [Micromonosporaceae bacterium]|nr:hypothetical protein [Micromonosporaceae bacterium]
MFGITTSYSTGLTALDAREDFGRARRSRLTAQVGHCITGRRSRECRPRWLLAPAALAAGTTRLGVVTPDSIVGTVEARTDFDARLRPASNRIRRRWERIALADRTGRALPPITLVRRPDGNYVIDACHRMSVAHARAPRHRRLGPARGSSR